MPSLHPARLFPILRQGAPPISNHSKMKPGRKATKTDSRTLALGDYLTPSLPPPPPAGFDQTQLQTDLHAIR